MSVTLPKAVQKAAEFDMLLAILDRIQPEVIVEIGVDRGGSFLRFAERYPEAELIGIDIGRGAYSSGPPLDDVRVIRGNSQHVETRRKFRRRLRGRRIDFLFIDGDHSFDGVSSDYWGYTRYVRAGGLVALHDIAEHPPEAQVHVREFWLRVKHQHTSAVEIVLDPDSWGGIAVFPMSER